MVSGGYRDPETPLRQGSIGQVCLFPYPRAQLNAAHSPTVSLAHHGLASDLARWLRAPFVYAQALPRVGISAFSPTRNPGL